VKLFFAVTSVANCMTVHNSAQLTSAKVRQAPCPGRHSGRLLLGGAFEIDLYLFAECTCGFDQRIQLNRNVAWILHSVELRAPGRHLLGHVQLRQLRRLHA
jgi:hypothetical protein